MKITAEMLELSASFVNPLGLLQLDLRGNRIFELENIFITRDTYEIVDLSDNEIQTLDNIPPLLNLKELYLCDNSIREINIDAQNLPNISVLNLHGNKISSISSISCLSELKSLRCLLLTENPICQLENYRERILETIPQLQVLDFQFTKSSIQNIVSNQKNRADDTNVDRSIMQDLIEKAESAHDITEIKRIEKLLSSGLIK